MNNFSLYRRLTEDGTISEPDGIPDPKYALPSTIHWVQSYAMLLREQPIGFASASDFYKNFEHHALPNRVQNSIFEHLLLAMHQLSALQEMNRSCSISDVSRVAGVAWYYGIYAAATAMVAAQDGSLQDNHTQTAKSWCRQFAERGLSMKPFNYYISTLVEKAANIELDAIRTGPKTNLVNPPRDVIDAQNYLCGYLSGTRKWYAWRIEEELKASKEFRENGFQNFRTKAARELRDIRLGKQKVSFLHQAIRFRGKANYREAMYLAHGSSVKPLIGDFVADLSVILESFLVMSGTFCFKRLGSELSKEFIADVSKYRAFELEPIKLWPLI